MKSMINLFLFIIFCVCTGCATVKLNFIADKTEPLEEFTLQGKNEREKILLIDIEGIISSMPEFKLIGESPSLVENIVSQLKKASSDPYIKAVLLKVDSPGGGTTASDLIYHELQNFKDRKKCPIVVLMMDLAPSGAYMVSLPADKIIAQPTSVTGSIGVIFFRPKIYGLCDKIGVSFDLTKSGEHKDMGSPFRKEDENETMIFQGIIDKLNSHFYELVAKHRKITDENFAKIKTARVFIAQEALNIGLIDQIGYPEDAIEECKKLAKIHGNPKLVAYRRKHYPEDNFYNTPQSKSRLPISLIEFPPFETMKSLKSGFYYIWPGALSL